MHWVKDVAKESFLAGDGSGKALGGDIEGVRLVELPRSGWPEIVKGF